MTGKGVWFGVAFIALFAFDTAQAAPPGDRVAMDGAGDRPGEWKLDFKNAGAGQLHAIQFVRVLHPRDVHDEVKYDVIMMTDDHRYPFGLWDTYLGKCDSHATADVWMGEIDAEGDAKGAPSIRTEFEPEIKHTPGYDTLEKICTGVAMEIVQDPIAYGRDYLKK